jgi:integral membrane sensor domain MASE1
VVAAVPFVLYAAFVVGSTGSVVVGALLFVPTVTAFVAAAIEVIDDRQGGAGGMMVWICLPLLPLDWFVALLGVAISRSTAPRTPSTRQHQPF